MTVDGTLFDSLMVKVALVGVLGIGAQWLAWRLQRPAIALMLLAGIVAGPVTGLIDPRADFGELFQPMVKLAVAVILFEGGLSLNFRDLRHAGWPVLRLVILGVPIGWVLGTLAAHYGAGLPWSVAALFGGILVVTGPTVIGPMLRTLRVGNRVRNILKWEGIVNDPIGALLAVAIFAYVSYEAPAVDVTEVVFTVLASTFAAGLIGAALGGFIVWSFPRGWVPEFLKAPMLLVCVILGFVLADLIMHETGLVTVTVMGVIVANFPVYSSRAMHRFKEDLTVLLISGVFILLSATLDWATLERFQLRFFLFLLLLLFVVRPVTVLASLWLSGVPWRERLFVAWIAPRGVVAIAVTSLFSLRLVDLGYLGADALVPLVFGVVVATIVAHGFSAGWVARRLGIDEGEGRGVLLIGANSWTIALGSYLKGIGYDVTVAAPSKYALRAARRADLNVHQGDLIDEAHGDDFDFGRFQQVIVATDNDSYNKLVVTDLGPEIGHERISIIAGEGGRTARRDRARVMLGSGSGFEALQDRIRDGWTFSRTRITDKFGWKEYQANLDADEEPVLLVKPTGQLLVFTLREKTMVETDDLIVSFVAPEAPETRKAERAAKVADKAARTGGEAPEPA